MTLICHRIFGEEGKEQINQIDTELQHRSQLIPFGIKLSFKNICERHSVRISLALQIKRENS